VTIVVPCGTSGTAPGGSGRRDGSSWGEWDAKNSLNELDPGARNARGSRPASAA
jgi:hypothetical protein